MYLEFIKFYIICLHELLMTWYILALISALFSAVAAITEKKSLFKQNALSFSFILAIFNLIIAIPFFFFIQYNLLSIPGLAVLFFKSILGAIAFLCVMLGIKNLEISKALPLLVLTPGLVAILAFISLGEALNIQEIMGMAFLLIGIYVLELKKGQNLLSPWRAIVKSKGGRYIIYALILFTITSVLDKVVLKNFKVPVNSFFAFQHLFLAIIFLIIVLSYKDLKSIRETLKSFKLYKWIILTSIFTVIYRYAQIFAVKLGPVALVLSIKRISVFFAVIIGGTLFRDKNIIRRTIATIILIIGAILIVTG